MLDDIKKQAISAVEAAKSSKELEDVRVKYLGKKGTLTEQMKKISTLAPEERKDFGALVNKTKQEVEANLSDKKNELENAELNQKLALEKQDMSVPIRPESIGRIHPISQVIDEITAIFAAQGFDLKEGPEIEDDFHNFTALNIPPNHPARQMQDTFYLNAKQDEQPLVLRTHTSSVQIRTMEKGKPPFKFIAAGRVYRSDYDMTHTPMFHQIEGLYIDKNVNMAQLKGCLFEFLQSFFGIENLPIRFRPSFFPFTEPSAEVDIGCFREDGQITIGKGSDWLEILGCGMVNPNVLKNVGIDPNEYQGFAFGLGIERLAMLKYGAPDLRNFFDSDARWLKNYGFAAMDIPSLVGGVA